MEVIIDAISKAAIQLSVFRNSDRASLIAQEACRQLMELQNSKEIFQWESKCACIDPSCILFCVVLHCPSNGQYFGG